MTNNFFKNNYTAVLGSESGPGLDLDRTVDSLFTLPIDSGPFSNSSRGSSAGVAILRLVFIGFSQLLNR